MSRIPDSHSNLRQRSSGFVIRLTCALVILFVGFQCGQPAVNSSSAEGNTKLVVNALESGAEASWSERMALSIMKRNPEAWMTDFRETPRWSYTNGLIMQAFVKLWKHTGDKKYFEYAKSYADTMIDDNGDIRNYHVDEFNIDHINPGKFLFALYDETGDDRYLKAIKSLRRQIEWQPRTTDGGFWHKRRYPWQMWLDGLYMGAPFYAEYSLRHDEHDRFDDIAKQFRLIQEHTMQNSSGLLYHGWDESRVQSWANPETGCSANIWGRAMGWYGMALVDVLDFIPPDHASRPELIGYLESFIIAVSKTQDSETGLWYQVLDQPERQGNYLEATASCMFVYTIAKAVNNGLVNNSHMATAKKGFAGILEHLIDEQGEGEIHLTRCCSVAGLGGNPYRDGSFEYYISEDVRNNDPKGTGPFILAVIEMEKYAAIAGN